MTAVAAGLAPDALRRAFGAFPSGVVAVAAEVSGERVGLAASSFTSVSLDPPLVSVSIARTSTTWPVLSMARRLGVSVLAGHHAAACRQLAGPAARRFEGLSVRRGPNGALFIGDAAAAFECSIEQVVPAGDHDIAVLRLHRVHHGSAVPLVFHRSRLVALGAPVPGD